MNDEEEYVLTMPKVRTSDSHYIAWDRENVINQILADTQLFEKFYEYPPATRELAGDVARAVEEAIEGLDLKYLKSSMVREFVCLEFLKRGMTEYHNACMRVGTSLHDAHAIDTGEGYGARDNANLQANPETSHKHKADKMSKEQYLYMMPPKVADAHLKSYIHIHDLEYFGTRSFCMDASTIVPVFNGKQIKTLTPAEMMLDPNAPVSVPKENICAFTPHGTRPITKITRRNIGDDTMYKIKTISGRSIKVTGEHRVPILRDGQHMVIPASEIRVNDVLTTINTLTNLLLHTDAINLIDAFIETVPLDMLGNVYVRNTRHILTSLGLTFNEIVEKAGLVNYSKKWYTTGSIPIYEFKQICNAFNITDLTGCVIGCTGSTYTLSACLPLNEYLMEVLGAFIRSGVYSGDASKGDYYLTITGEPDRLLQYTNILMTMGINVTRYAPQREMYFGNKLVYLLFRYALGIKHATVSERLPSIVYNVREPLATAFMQGLFAIGRLHKHDLYTGVSMAVASMSEKMRQEVVLLLQKHGITVNIHDIVGDAQFLHFVKNKRSDRVGEYIVRSIESVVPSDGWVYDIFLDGDGSDESHTFIAGDGILIHNCMDSDLRYLYYYGFMPDGKGSSASVSAPAKNPEVAVLHAVKYLAASQTNFAGGQGYYNFLTFIAPYFEGLSYTQIKQYMQMMVYELTQMMIARGGQVIFSSLQLSPGVPTLWRDIPAVYKGRVWDGTGDVPKRTYGEFEQEVRLAFEALMDVMIEGDYWGKPFNFPKPEISIEPDFVTISDEIAAWDAEHPDIPTYKDLYLMAFDLAAKFGTPYFDNQIPAYRGAGKGISCYQCCLTGDTEVIAKRNDTVHTMPIEDLMPDDLLFTPTGFQPFASLLIQTIDGDTYEEDLVEITTDMGKVIRCTEDHMIPVHRGDSMDLTFVRADTVGIGDALCINNTLYYTDSLDNLEELCDDLGEELIAVIKSVPYTGKVYDPINVEGRTFWLRNGILSSNCAYNFSSNIDEDDEFFDKVYFRNGAHFSMGSLQVVTLNCPRAAYDAGNDVEKLIRNLKNYMNVARDVFVIKKRWIDEIIKCNKLPFVVQRPRDPVTGEPGTMAVDMDGLVCTIGVLGVNEMVQAITGYQLHESKEARKTALYVLAELNKHARTLSEEVGLKIVVARTPAETTCQRFAVSDLLNPEYTEKARAVVHGDIEAFDRMKKTTRDLPVYYTNGTHVAVDAPVSLPERMNIENPFFVLVQGGNIFHVWLGEAHPDPRGLYDFCMNIATRTQIGYFALTRDMTVPVNRYTWYTGE